MPGKEPRRNHASCHPVIWAIAFADNHAEESSDWTAVVRLNTDGSLDTAFRAATLASAHGRPLLLQPDGKIIVDGKWRLHPDGSLDYAAATGTLHFAPGELEKTISISIIPNNSYQGERVFNVALHDTTPGIRAPSASDARVIIFDNDPGLTFSQKNYDVYGGAISTNGTVWPVEYVLRHGDLAPSLTVQCQLVAGTAVAGQDFVATNLTLHFPPHQYEMPVLVPLLGNDHAIEDRTLFLVLNHPNPNMPLAADATAVLTIWGNPRPARFFPDGSVLEQTGRLRLACDIRPRQYAEIQTSTNLVDWIYLGSIYRELNAGPLFFEDPDAWKYGQRFYRIPQYQGSGD